MSSVQKTGIIVASAILLVLAFLVGNELASMSAQEKLLASTYEQQLDAILFSVNQHAWDVVDSWARDVDGQLERAPTVRAAYEALETLLEQEDELVSAFTSDARLGRLRVIAPGLADTMSVGSALDLGTLGPLISKLRMRSQPGYRPLEPLALPDVDPDSLSTIVFTSSAGFPETSVVGLTLDSRSFLSNVIGRKLLDLANEQFELTVVSRRADGFAVGLDGQAVREPDLTTSIWVFEDFEIGIAAAGGGIGALTRARLYRSLGLVALLASAVIAGIWFLYRNVKRESDLAQQKADFVSSVSHELRTPLSVISMYAETLRLGRLSGEDKRQDYYRIIGDEAERLSHLVNNVLNFSSIASGTKSYDSVSLDLNDIVREIEETYRGHLESRGFEVEVRLSPEEVRISGDRGAVHEAVVNLVDNAVKYSTADRVITLACGRMNGVAGIEVRDKGVGIEPKEQSRIFDRFYRAQRGLEHDVKGTGLGLAIVKHIMDAHGGSIRVESEPEAGSSFTLVFPTIDSVDDPA